LYKLTRRGTRVLPILILILALSIIASGCAPRGATNAGWTVVTATDDLVHAVLASGVVISLNPETGDEVWRYPPPGERRGGLGALFSRSDSTAPQPLDAVYGPPVVAGDLLLITSLDRHLYAFDRTTGVMVWKYDVGEAIVGGVTVRDGVAYFGANDYRVYALNIDTQELVWPEPFETGNWVWGRPAVDDNRVYVGSMDHSVYALDRATGALVWSYRTGGAIACSVSLTDGLVLVGAVDKNIYALDRDSGELVWSQALDQWIMGEPLVYDGYAYVATLNGQVHALSVKDGSSRWEPASVQRSVRAGPQLVNGTLLVATEAGELWSVSTDGGVVARVYPDIGEPGADSGLGAMLSEPAVVGTVAYVGTTAGHVLAADTTARMHPEIWIYSPTS